MAISLRDFGCPRFNPSYARHDRGLFDDIRVKDMRKEIASWEKHNASSLSPLLDELVELAATSRTNLIQASRDQAGFRRREYKVLPPNLKAVWAVYPGDNKETRLQEKNPPTKGTISFKVRLCLIIQSSLQDLLELI
jgi:hypothetical protein